MPNSNFFSWTREPLFCAITLESENNFRPKNENGEVVISLLYREETLFCLRISEHKQDDNNELLEIHV